MTGYDASEINKENSGRNGGNLARVVAYGMGCLLLFALLFHSAYRHLYAEWQGEDYNYCWFVPLISLYLLWEKRQLLRAAPAVSSWSGLVPLSLGIAFYWLGELGGEFYTIYIGSWLVLVGFAWIYTGWNRMKVAAAPLIFLIAMFPFPKFITNNLTLELKLVSSKLGVLMLQWCGMAAYREGNVIDLGFTRLQVVDACSGLRYFFPLVIMGILLAYYYRGALWKKALLVFSTVPISIVTNGLRIASVGFLYQFWGAAAAEGLFHDFSGWFIFMASLGILLLEMWALKKVFKEGEEQGARSEERGTGSHKSEVRSREKYTTFFPNASFPSCKFAVAALLLIVSIIISQTVDFREKVPSSRPFDQFPLVLSGWQGVRTTMEKEFLDVLKFDDYVMVDYRDRGGKTVSLYTAYFGSQTKGGSIHSPKSCLPGGGWNFEESGDVDFPLGNGAGTMRVNRSSMEKGGTRMLTYYWFPQRGRILTSLFELKLFTFWNAMTSRRTDGALVRVITPIYGSERLADADARLQGFTREITPVLATFLPR